MDVEYSYESIKKSYASLIASSHGSGSLSNYWNLRDSDLKVPAVVVESPYKITVNSYEDDYPVAINLFEYDKIKDITETDYLNPTAKPW